MPQDILFKTDEYVFSYRVAGILRREGRVLLQKPSNDPGYAFPGGHVEIGETGAQTLRREFLEEIGAKIRVDRLAWAGEIFFPWGNRPCHQICFYYFIALEDPDEIPLEGSFEGVESMEGKSFRLEYHWVDIKDLDKILLYPPQCRDFLMTAKEGFQHFVYVE